MKKLLCLLALLLALTTAHAEENAPLTAVKAVYPALTVTASAQDAQDAFFILTDEAGAHRLVRLTQTDGAWQVCLENHCAIRPSGVSDGYTRYLYSDVSLSLAEDTLSILYTFMTGSSFQYDFVRRGDAFRFDRVHVTEATYPAMSRTIRYEGESLRQVSFQQYHNEPATVTELPPVPASWLAACRDLATFDALAFPLSVPAMLEEQTALCASELLPGFTFIDGCFSSRAATFLVRTEEGDVVFAGCAWNGTGWDITLSTPLPEGVWCDSFHAGDGYMSIGHYLEGRVDDWGEPLFVDYGIELEEDGRWRVQMLFNSNEEACFFERDFSQGIWINMIGPVWGPVTLERDITRIDWAAYPTGIGEVLPLVSTDWGLVSEPDLPLYAAADGAGLIGSYHCGTPVQILSYEGEYAQVRIAGGCVTGWLEAYGLLLGGEQLMTHTWTDEDGTRTIWINACDSGWYLENGPSCCFAEALPDAVFLDAPDGQPLSGDDGWVQVLCRREDGWVHVLLGECGPDAFIRAEQLKEAE